MAHLVAVDSDSGGECGNCFHCRFACQGTAVASQGEASGSHPAVLPSAQRAGELGQRLTKSSTSWVEVEVEGKRELLELFVRPTKLAAHKAWFPAAAEVSISVPSAAPSSAEGGDGLGELTITIDDSDVRG